MIRAFFLRWWITRKLHAYIYRGEAIRAEMGVPRRQIGNILTEGVSRDEFSQFMVYIYFHKNIVFKALFKSMKWSNEETLIFQDIADALQQAITAGYITETYDSKLILTNRGKEVYVWYFPIFRFFQLEYSKVVLSRILGWGIPALIVFLLSKYLHITINISS